MNKKDQFFLKNFILKSKFLKNITYNCFEFIDIIEMTNKRLIVDFEDLPEEVVDALNIKYPDGFENHVMKVEKGNNNFFYGVTVDFENTSYLVKVDVSIDSNIDDFDDDNIESTDEEKDELLTGLEDEPSTEDEDVIG